MSSLENIYQKMMPTVTPASPTTTPIPAPAWSDPSPQMSREVAHDLNNILTLIQGYAERMMMRHGDNPALHPDLQHIKDNAKRAALVVRRATPRRAQLLPAHAAE
jgi:hypothetical protein